MFSLLRPAIVLIGLFTLVTGLIYPAAITGLSLLAYPHQARGSLVERDGKVVGSSLIGQNFTDPKYFWPRPSAALDGDKKPYAADASAGPNLGSTSAALHERIAGEVERLRAGGTGAVPALVPVGLATASASGLDPHLAPADARFQVGRVAAARQLPEPEIRALVESMIEARELGFLGEPRVNVLRLNLALDGLARR